MSDLLDEPMDNPKESGYHKKKYAPILVIGPLLIIALFFKTMHWPGGNVIYFGGLSALIGHAMAILYHFQKNDFITNVGAILLPAVVVWRFMNTMNPDAWPTMGGVALVSFLACVWYFRD
jgi:hypothetical protein